MKKLFTQTISLLLVTAMAFLTGSCKKEEVAKDATVGIKVTATTTSSITFELSSTDAVKVSYQVSAAEAAGAYTDVEVTGDDPVSVTVSELQENTEYTIRANATNRDGKVCPDVTATATTTTNASVSIEVKSWTSSSVTFAINPVNAVSYSYAVVESTAKPDEAELTEKVENGESGEYTVEGLKENTSYTVVAAAVNASGDESKRAYGTFKTEQEPVVTIESITPDSKQVSVVISAVNADTYAYAAVVKGEPEPDHSEFTTGSVSGTSASFIIANLEPETAYTLYVYGINAKKYEGSTVSEDFTTLEFVQKPFEINVSNISCNDADIEVSFDKEVYQKFYYVSGRSEAIGDVQNWDWESKIESGWSYPLYGAYTDNLSTTLRMWSPDGTDYGMTVGGSYMVGGIPEKADGTLDLEAAVWTPVQLKEAVLEESDITCTINSVAIGADSFTFNVTTNDPSNTKCCYISELDGEVTDNAQIIENIETVLQRKPTYQFETDTTRSSLQAEKTYTFVVVPKDKEGRLGKVSTIVVTTKSVDYVGDARCTVTLSEFTQTYATFGYEKGENCDKILYHYAAKDQYFNRESFEKTLKVNNRNVVEGDGKFVIEELDSDTDYIFGFAPVDKYGIVGECVYIEERSPAYDFNGNADATVVINVTSCVESGNGYYKVVIEAKPNENVQKYYMATTSSGSTLTKTSFVNGCVKGNYTAYTEDATMSGWGGSGVSVASESVVWVLAVDQEGKFVPVAETKIEGTWK